MGKTQYYESNQPEARLWQPDKQLISAFINNSWKEASPRLGEMLIDELLIDVITRDGLLRIAFSTSEDSRDYFEYFGAMDSIWHAFYRVYGVS